MGWAAWLRGIAGGTCGLLAFRNGAGGGQGRWFGRRGGHRVWPSWQGTRGRVCDDGYLSEHGKFGDTAQASDKRREVGRAEGFADCRADRRPIAAADFRGEWSEGRGGQPRAVVQPASTCWC